MQRAQLKEFYGYGLIVLVLIAVQMYSVYIATTTDLILTWKHYAGFIATLLAGILWVIRKPDYVFYALGLTLILGYENLIGFTPTLSFTSTRYYFNSTALPISYQDFSMYMLIIWAYIAHNRLRAMAISLVKRGV